MFRIYLEIYIRNLKMVAIEDWEFCYVFMFILLSHCWTVFNIFNTTAFMFLKGLLFYLICMMFTYKSVCHLMCFWCPESLESRVRPSPASYWLQGSLKCGSYFDYVYMGEGVPTKSWKRQQIVCSWSYTVMSHTALVLRTDPRCSVRATLDLS